MSGHYHLIGIGGIGMSGIARLLLFRGMRVSGSDIKEGQGIAFLRRQGAEVYIGHRAENIRGAGIAVYSSAIKKDNPELQEARRMGIPVIRRAEALSRLMADETAITVTGSHGKTTTTSLVSFLLMDAGFSPTAAIGGILRNIDTNACLGKGEFFVAEADESDGSFLYYQPQYSIITNIDHEHLDYYKDFESEVQAFSRFIRNTRQGGCVFACGDDKNLRSILKGYPGRHIFFGISEGSDIRPENISIKGLSSEFDCLYYNKPVSHFELSLGGLHNISNSLAVIALGLELGIGPDKISKALGKYPGTHRRLETRFKNQDYLLLDDYAHHPTEIKATLDAIKYLGAKRVIAVFQPHRYSRTSLLLDEFSGSFDSVGYLVVTDIYAASERPIEGVDAEALAERIKERLGSERVDFLPKEKIVGHILKIIKPGDLVITLGAGDIVKTCEELAGRLKG
ncbi:MAG: UDP-N-acetylmuramate--L-alanine ligase [Candidatus Omnitrophota bacterium]